MKSYLKFLNDLILEFKYIRNIWINLIIYSPDYHFFFNK